MNLLSKLSNVGKAIMLPIAVLPIAGLLLRFGQNDILEFFYRVLNLDTFFLKEQDFYKQFSFIAVSGSVIFENIALLFSIGVAIGIAKGNDNGSAGLAGAVFYFVLTGVMKSIDASNNMGVLAGVISGLSAGALYNRYSEVRFPDWLAFFSGRRFVPIMSGLVGLILGVILGFFWIYAQQAIAGAGDWIVKEGSLGVAVYGLFNRLLLMFGLHHILNSLVWFDLGEFVNQAGDIVKGDLTRFWAGDKTAGVFMAGFFPVMMFGLPGAALAIYATAKPAKRMMVGGLLLSTAFTSFVTGITEPLEYTFIFISPLLYLLHGLLTAISMSISYIFDYKAGFTFSAGAIDAILSWKLATHPTFLMILGPIMTGLYFVVFWFAIKTFDIKTLGREDDEDTVPPENRLNISSLGLKYIEFIGGLGNIVELDNCVTRLRLVLKDANLIQDKKLEALGAKSIIRIGKSGTVQIIVGTQVETLANEMRYILRRNTVVESGEQETIEDSPIPSESDLQKKGADELKKEKIRLEADREVYMQAPASGKVVKLDDVPDMTFANRIVGDGFALDTKDEIINSPVSGVIVSLPKEAHAFVIKSDNGLEFLVHIGVETVMLKGEGFTTLRSNGERVEVGDPIVKVDWDIIESKKFVTSSLVSVLCSSMSRVDELVNLVSDGQQVSSGDKLLKAVVL